MTAVQIYFSAKISSTSWDYTSSDFFMNEWMLQKFLEAQGAFGMG
ncbi:MAG: hypothetical protein AAFN09_12010 [Pseudomonadota bacterium]